jgi:UDP-glucose:(heptosyl)LPS alpha-1,3-glucosyltransferase
MKLAFALFKYFPYGGLQRDCMKIAEECVQRGHTVDIYTLQSEGSVPDGVNLHLLPQRCKRNYKRYEAFAAQVIHRVNAEGYSGLVGFNKMPGLDVYYAADPCFAAKAKTRSIFYRWSGRSRSFLASEDAVFSAKSKTHALLISAPEQQIFKNIYQTDSSRMHMLPPGVQKDRLVGDDYAVIRATKRQELGLGEEKMLLMVGSGFKTKGLDRSLLAIAALPEDLRNQVRLYVVGQDNIKQFQRQARSLGIDNKFYFLGGRSDVAHLLFAADLLLHPAYRENTGTVLLEAMAASLPQLVSGTCGYSYYVEQAQCGAVLNEPFSQQQMNEKLVEILTRLAISIAWQQNAQEYLSTHDIFSMPQRAVDVIEQVLT